MRRRLTSCRDQGRGTGGRAGVSQPTGGHAAAASAGAGGAQGQACQRRLHLSRAARGTAPGSWVLHLLTGQLQVQHVQLFIRRNAHRVMPRIPSLHRLRSVRRPRRRARGGAGGAARHAAPGGSRVFEGLAGRAQAAFCQRLQACRLLPVCGRVGGALRRRRAARLPRLLRLRLRRQRRQLGRALLQLQVQVEVMHQRLLLVLALVLVLQLQPVRRRRRVLRVLVLQQRRQRLHRLVLLRRRQRAVPQRRRPRLRLCGVAVVARVRLQRLLRCVICVWERREGAGGWLSGGVAGRALHERQLLWGSGSAGAAIHGSSTPAWCPNAACVPVVLVQQVVCQNRTSSLPPPVCHTQVPAPT